MPTRQLPPGAHLEHLKQQAADLLADCAAGDPRACQRLREFHSGFADADDRTIAAAPLRWSDGLFAIAREYGFRSWPRLKAQVEQPAEDAGQSLVGRIADPLLREAVERIDDGDTDGLSALLDAHPDLTRRHARFEGMNYFRSPALLAFVAENPIRNDALPPNIVEIAALLLSRGTERTDLDETLALVASGRVPREAGVQAELIAQLCRAGADPGQAVPAAAAHGEFGALEALRANGAQPSLPLAATLGDTGELRRLLPAASAKDRHLALALAAQHGRAEALTVLLEAGEDPNRYNPPGAHAHSTPLHQAAWYGHEAAVRTLLAHGARRDLGDTMWNATPEEWARHADRPTLAELIAGAP